MDNADEIIGRNIQRRRKGLGMDQATLARKVGLTTKSLSQIETGKSRPRRSNLIAIAKELNCSVMDLSRLILDENHVDSEDLVSTVRSAIKTEFAALTKKMPKDDLALARAMDEIKRLREQVDSVPPEFWAVWPQMAPHAQQLFLSLLGAEQDLPLLVAEKDRSLFQTVRKLLKKPSQ